MRTSLATIIGIAFCLAVGFTIDRAHTPPQVPSPTQIQTMLYERGYDLGPQGIDGKIWGPCSVKAWDRCICDQSAGIWLNQFTMKGGTGE